ncbi:MAG: cbb3-type cytochrome oxidase assembly protein CcoS [Pontibacterium sp.]
MDIIFILIPIAVILVGCAIGAFFWSVNTGQFEDLESPAHSILYDDDDHLVPNDTKATETDIKTPADKAE